MAETTPADELQAAAKTLREWAAEGEAGCAALMPPSLAEAFAALLEAIYDPYTAMPDGVILSLDTAIRRRGVVAAQAINWTQP